MNKTLKFYLKRYRMFLILLAVNLCLGLAMPTFGRASFENTTASLSEMFSVMPPIFVLLGLLDVWVEKETMMRYLGKGSGFRGVVMAFALGACAAGPLYAAFPVATVMLKKRASLFNVFVFVGAWSTAKIPLLTFEATSLGFTFMLTRLALNLIGIPVIAWVVDKSLSAQQQEEVYEIAEQT